MSFAESQKLQTPIEYLKGVGPRHGDLLRKELGIATLGHLLFHFPFRYEDKSQFSLIRDLFVDQTALIKGTIQSLEVMGGGRKQRLVARLQDESGSLELIWFRGIKWIEKSLRQNKGEVEVYGKVTRFGRKMSISHPEIELSSKQDGKYPYKPIYPSTENLSKHKLSGKNYAKLSEQLFQIIQAKDVEENLPASILQSQKLMDRFQALKEIHFPSSKEKLHAAQNRLKFEELFLEQMNICRIKLNRKREQGFIFDKVGDYFNEFYKKHIPFELTGDQKKVIKEIREDCRTGFQMNRLLQGDVGSGKTMAALLAMLLAIDNDFQACLLAPTEILAQQHYQKIKAQVKPLGIKVHLLTGSVKTSDRKPILESLEDGSLQILIGTHAVLENKVKFKNLGLCIIDEQHRFGVAQRAKMRRKNKSIPHILVMTATPIPRTLALTSYGDLDVSTIEELPPGRKEIRTVHRFDTKRPEVMTFLKTEIEKGRQIYIVFPLIQESEKLDYENLESGYENLKNYFPADKYNMAMVHGRQDLEEREYNMKNFVEGRAHILVATTVIEVGVDVPNASVMLIESAERFGLSQLHQLRGRVGRGAESSFCVLMTGRKISATGKERIETMVQESSGFAISQKDLELRGPGEIAGTRQSGTIEFKLAHPIEDIHIMEDARNEALILLSKDPGLKDQEHTALRKFLRRMHGSESWSEVG